MPRRRPPMFCAPNAYFQIFVWAEHSSEIAVESPLRGVQPLRPLLCLDKCGDALLVPFVRYAPFPLLNRCSVCLLRAPFTCACHGWGGKGFCHGN